MYFSNSQLNDSAASSKRARLLVVDDDSYMRELYALVLNLEGYDVETASDGAAALELLANEAFDLVLTDRSMPNLDGASMVLSMRSSGIAIPVVMVSGSLVQAPLPPGVTREISATVSKPASAGKILHAVARALSGAARPESPTHSGKPQDHEAQSPVRKTTPGPHKSAFATGWSKIFTSVVLHLRPGDKESSSTSLRFGTPMKKLTSTESPAFEHKTPYGR
jgi:CheY-like chemotaxis protein